MKWTSCLCRRRSCERERGKRGRESEGVGREEERQDPTNSLHNHVPCADVHEVGEELGRVHVAERVVGVHEHEGPHAAPLLTQSLDPRLQILGTEQEALTGGIDLGK